MQHVARSEYPAIEPFRDEPALIAHVKQRLDAARGDRPYPKVHVIGALGRCGSGAVAFCRDVGIPEDRIIKWDINETKGGGPFPDIMQSDIFVNCIYLSQPIPPFLDKATLAQGGPLSVLVDVSCDITNPHNPLPVYSSATTFRHPVLKVPRSDKYVASAGVRRAVLAVANDLYAGQAAGFVGPTTRWRWWRSTTCRRCCHARRRTGSPTTCCRRSGSSRSLRRPECGRRHLRCSTRRSQRLKQARRPDLCLLNFGDP